jgi:hypothetical protein
LYLFWWWTTRIQTIFFFVKNTSIHGQKVLNPFFCSSNCLSAIYKFFYSVHTISHVWKKLTTPAPYISDQFFYYRSDLPTLLSTFSKISQNFCHYPVFYMHTITCSFQAEEQWKKHFYLFIFCIFHWFGRRVGSRQRGCKHFSEFFQGGFLLRIFFYWKGWVFRFIST